MTAITLAELDQQLRQLPPEKLSVVYDFVQSLIEHADELHEAEGDDSARATMYASEAVLRRDWASPEEDAAWAHL